MIYLYLIDYHSHFKTNGLATYVSQLQLQLFKEKRICLHFVWVNSNVKDGFLKKQIKNNLHYFIPGPIDIPVDKERFDKKAAEYLAGETANKQNIIFHFNWINQAPFARLLKQQIPGCKTVLTKHCIPWRDFIIKDYATFVYLDKKLKGPASVETIHPALIREKVSYDSVDHVICVTDFAKMALQKMLQVQESKISVIYNGLESIRTSDKKERLRKKYGFGQKEKILFFAGKLHQSKGVNDLVAAFGLLQESTKNEDVVGARLVIAGTGNYDEVLKNSNTVFSKITITGFLDKKRLYEFYQMADIGIVPSYVEQCSYTAIEMMYFGLPLIVSDVDGLREIVPDDCGLKVPLILGRRNPYINQKRLVDSIQFYFENPETAARYAANARHQAQKNFTAKRMAAATVAVYEQLIDQRESAAGIIVSEWDPLVTVLLYCYNAETHLRECINSILGQAYSKFELLIVDGGSTDKSGSIIKSYKDERIVFLKNDTNEGLVKTLNKGIKAAKGKYIARIGAGDVMHPERLQKQVRFLENKKHSRIAVTGSHHYVIDPSGKMIGLTQYPVADKEIKAIMSFQNPFSSSSVMIRSHVLKKYRYTSKYPDVEDHSLWFKIAAQFGFASIPDFLTYRRMSDAHAFSEHANMKNKHIAALLSDELERLGVEYTSSELAIHMAISFGYGKRYFNTPEKEWALQQWLDKLFYRLKGQYDFSENLTAQMKQYVLENFCGGPK
ncbi:glycosyltransferase [Niabella drilacis]|uniref:Glycosyltransferase n=1 Tax=Niabella drilacis (strain DSM 25811 / CCM 8410 / CCUG 62505 / LMG 26954 / E90) TaxID=1285928 RepID=A0A1G6V151_NIADE|nr:glycosyltransferase [Niabella drilacis]SDD47268.1 glycosyltransferase [Niabella drilacis]